MTRARAATALAVTLTACLTLTACSGAHAHQGDTVTTTVDGLRADTVMTLRQLAAVARLSITEAEYGPESCNDQGDPPFQPVVEVWVQRVRTDSEADAELKSWVSAMTAAGWTTPTDFHTHATASLSKDGWVAILSPQNPSDPEPIAPIELRGPCTDVSGKSHDSEFGVENIAPDLR